MNNFIAKASEALGRVESLVPPTKGDVHIIRPLLQKLIASSRTPFLRKTDSYVIGTEKFPVLVGLDYIRLLLQKPNEQIHCRDLLSLECNRKPLEGTREQDIEFRVMEELRTNYAGADVASSYQAALDDKALRALKDSITTLEDAQTIENLEELDFLKQYLAQNTYCGKSRQLQSVNERARKSVAQSINYSLQKLQANEATRGIGNHLDKNIKRGITLQYVGNWQWKL